MMEIMFAIISSIATLCLFAMGDRVIIWCNTYFTPALQRIQARINGHIIYHNLDFEIVFYMMLREQNIHHPYYMN